MRYLLCLVFVLVFQDNWYNGTVSYVIDGDTFVLQTTEGSLKVRMEGIDCPEKDQAFGPDAKAFLNQYKDKKCRVQKTGVDQYGRTLGILWVDSMNINLLMVEEGLAWHFKKYSKDKALADAEIRARKAQKNIWWTEGAMPPWEWRKRKN